MQAFLVELKHSTTCGLIIINEKEQDETIKCTTTRNVRGHSHKRMIYTYGKVHASCRVSCVTTEVNTTVEAPQAYERYVVISMMMRTPSDDALSED